MKQLELYLSALEEAIKAITEEFYNTYSGYLTALGQAVRQQLILATYHVCTRAYPDVFLGLSFNQRQEFQQILRQLTGQAQQQLMSPLESLKQSAETTTDTEKSPPNPEKLAQWQEQMEQSITQTLLTLSRETNRLLQTTGILPKKLPEIALEVATKADAAHSDPVAGPPNLINLLIETEIPEPEEVLEGFKPSPTATPVIAVNLRLSDIEFADASVMALRNQIRNLSGRLTTLRREFQKKQRERTIAEAEAAWRNSWSEN